MCCKICTGGIGEGYNNKTFLSLDKLIKLSFIFSFKNIFLFSYSKKILSLVEYKLWVSYSTISFSKILRGYICIILVVECCDKKKSLIS